MRIHKIAKFDSIYNIFKITEVNGVAEESIVKYIDGQIVNIKADSTEQARKIAMNKFSKLAEWENEFAGRTIIARLNEEKMIEIEKYRQTMNQLEKAKEDRAQNIYD